MGNIFAEILSFIGSVVTSIIDFFGGIVETIVGLALNIIITPIVLLLGLLNTALAGIMDILVGSLASTLAIFIPDMQRDGTAFDSTFGALAKAMDGTILLMALSILIIIYAFQLIKLMMTSGENVADTPLALTARTFVAGVFIYYGETILKWISGLAGIFFNAIWGTAPQSFSFVQFVTTIQGYLLDASVAVINVPSAEQIEHYGGIANVPSGAGIPQISALVANGMISILIILIGIKFVGFFIEIISRYVLFGMLLVFSPLGFSLAGSRNTSGIFVAWLKMVFAQMMILIIDAMICVVFLNALQSHTITDALSGVDIADQAGACVCTVSLLYAILYTGTQLNSLFNRLGLNAGTMGSGIGAEIGSVIMLTRMVSQSAQKSNTRTSNTKVLNSSQGDAVGQKNPRNIPVGKATFGGTAIDANPIGGNDGHHQIGGVYSIPVAQSSQILENAKGFPTSVARQIDHSKTTMVDGVMNLHEMAVPGKPSRAYQLTPKDRVDTTQIKGTLGGRPVSIKGKDYWASQSDGERNNAFYYENGQAEKAFKEAYPDLHVEKATDRNGEWTGAWQSTTVNPETGVISMQQWAPTNTYTPDVSLGRNTEQIGDMTYYSYRTKTRGEHSEAYPGMPQEPAGRQQWVQSEMSSSMNNAFVQSVDFVPGSDDVLQVKTNEGVSYLAPISNYAVPEDAQAEIVTTNDGAEYVQVTDVEALQKRSSTSGVLAHRAKEENVVVKREGKQTNNLIQGAKQRSNNKKAK